MDEKTAVKEIEQLIKKGRFFRAYNESACALRKNPNNIRIKQLYGLSLAQIGATNKARQCIEELYKEGHRDAETSGILGRIHKDIWRKTGEVSHARLSRDIYNHGFKLSKDYYPGINAATMSLVIGEKNLAEKIAEEVISTILGRKKKKDFWALATLGEAYLILGDDNKATRYYRDALSVSGRNFGEISSTFHQINLISEYTRIPDEVYNILKPPKIVAFAGHMIDHPERKMPRFPEDISGDIKKEIARVLDELDAGIGYSSAACGADLLFIEAMHEREAEVNILLPFNREDFILSSVSFAGGEWENRFNNALEKSSVKFITEESYFGNDDLFAFTNNVIMGASILRGNLLMTRPHLMTVFDMDDMDHNEGGTGEILKKWPDSERITVIDPSVFLKGERRKKTKQGPGGKGRTGKKTDRIPFGITRELKCVLFADIEGFCKIDEEQTPYFMFELLQTLNNSINHLNAQPEILNTWGDAIFAVYDNPVDLMEFALVIKTVIQGTDWASKNLPDDINIRIALHTGPVFIGVDPITGNKNSYGSHINRVARMEPVTFPGCIYTSDQFAAMLILETSDRYHFEYVGNLELPKDFGEQEIYHVYR